MEWNAWTVGWMEGKGVEGDGINGVGCTIEGLKVQKELISRRNFFGLQQDASPGFPVTKSVCHSTRLVGKEADFTSMMFSINIIIPLPEFFHNAKECQNTCNLPCVES